jgi:hypothetical protein
MNLTSLEQTIIQRLTIQIIENLKIKSISAALGGRRKFAKNPWNSPASFEDKSCMWECLNAKPARSLSKNLANWLSESLRRKL